MLHGDALSAAQEDLELRVELAPGAIDERLLHVEGAGVVGVADELRLAGGHEVEPAVQGAARLDHVDGDGVLALPIGEQPAVELVGGEARPRIVEPRGHQWRRLALGRRRRGARRDADRRMRGRRRCDEEREQRGRAHGEIVLRLRERGSERVVQAPVAGEDLAAVAVEGAAAIVADAAARLDDEVVKRDAKDYEPGGHWMRDELQ